MPLNPTTAAIYGLADAAHFGFSPDATGMENTRALQRAVEDGGTVVVSTPGTYKIGGTVYLGSHTTLLFANNVFLQKVEENGPFCHVFLNKGALSKTYDQNIIVSGLHILVNGVDSCQFEVYGLRGQIAFFYIKDLRIERFRCLDLGSQQFAIHICTFEDAIVDDVIIKGDKDGVHFGRGRRFTVRNGVFQTHDDAIALNAHDYATSNPELGWIEDGVIENCHDLPDDKPIVGNFCRLPAGAWCDWYAGMEVQQSDTVVSQGRLYRVQNRPDGTVYRSQTPPSHESGSQEIDGINWGMVQTEEIYTAGVRNVTFRDIFLHKPRTAFLVNFDHNRFNRSYYPGAPKVQQEELLFQNIRVLHDQKSALMAVSAPVDVVTFANSSIRENNIVFYGETMPDYGSTSINFIGCVFRAKSGQELVANEVEGKKITLQISASVEIEDDFVAIA